MPGIPPATAAAARAPLVLQELARVPAPMPVRKQQQKRWQRQASHEKIVHGSALPACPTHSVPWPN